MFLHWYFIVPLRDTRLTILTSNELRYNLLTFTIFIIQSQVGAIPVSDFEMTRMITDRTGRHEFLLSLLNQQEVERVVVITDSHKLFWSCAVETDAFPASFDKSKDLTSCRIQFPQGYVFPPAHLMGKLTARKHNGLQGKNALSTVILKKITHSKGHFIFSSFLTS